ncbi:MAG: UDP-2,3-diacylglucosamine diphosphatase LpxI [bacterium]|nr:UDP-2,3-diacylglucosamine diphosphatase LpxI [bacterium]
MRRVGIIAGEGRLPLIAAKELKKQAYDIVVVCIVSGLKKSLKEIANKVYEIEIGKIGEIIDTLNLHEVKDLVMLGKVKKQILYQDIVLDEKTISLLSKIKNKSDDTILKAIVEELEKEGIFVVDQTKYLKRLLPSKGVLSERKPNLRENEDINYGWEMAKGIAGLDIGQTVIVKEKAVVAVEAIEGTDKAILRAGEIAGADAVVVKVSKPQQDFRFDVPTVGINTMESIIEAKARVLAIESGKTLVVHKEEMIALANKFGIVFTVI